LLSGLQIAIFDPRLSVMDQLACAHFGIEEFEYEWCNIFPESSAEQAKRALDVSKALECLITTGAITREAANEVVKHTKIFGGAIIGDAPKEAPPLLQQQVTQNANSGNSGAK